MQKLYDVRCKVYNKNEFFHVFFVFVAQVGRSTSLAVYFVFCNALALMTLRGNDDF